jgi:hypothetical protein
LPPRATRRRATGLAGRRGGRQRSAAAPLEAFQSSSWMIFHLYVFETISILINVFLSWIGSISYSLQLYFDFSGYSDMAVGLGLIFGIILQEFLMT